jgi:colanic acid biosynthesis glycosyl transferase WcaI
VNILILGINYAPEMVGIGPYTAGMAQFLAQAGHSVTVVAAKPYYPQWKVDPAYAGAGRGFRWRRACAWCACPTTCPRIRTASGVCCII